MGKGSKRRPAQIPPEEYAKHFEDIFGKKKMWWEKDRDLYWIKNGNESQKRTRTSN